MRKLFALGALAMLVCGCSQEVKNGPDLAMYGIKGHVKMVESYLSPSDEMKSMNLEQSWLVSVEEYDQTGHQLAEQNDSLPKVTVERDANDRMVRSTMTIEDYSESVSEYFYHGVLCDSIVTYESGEISRAITRVSRYDAEGNTLSHQATMIFDGNIMVSNQSYTILEHDNHGNWTKMHMVVRTREQLLDENNELADAEEDVKYWIQSRNIIYWE